MKTISCEALKEQLETNREHIYLLDVREIDEYRAFNIGGILLSVKEIEHLHIKEIESLKDKKVVCYCRSGRRSALACNILEKVGFKDITNLEGGMLAWQEKYNSTH